MLFLLIAMRCTAAVQLHKLEPRLNRAGLFNGWCVRATAPEGSATSFIVGSFSSKSGSLSSHVCAVATTFGEKSATQVLLPGDAARLDVLERPGPRFEWKCAEIGFLEATPERVRAELAIDRVRASVDVETDGKGWNAEGWVGRFGRIVPCRYHVHALRAPCSLVVNDVSTPAIAHVESNYGSGFPSEWIWVQAASEETSLLAVGGLFKPFKNGYTWLVSYRSPEFDVDFRSTDLLKRPKVVGCDIRKASVRLDLETRQKGKRYRLEILATASPDSFFDDRLYVPTEAGSFSNDPGSAETFDAIAYVRAYRGTKKDKLELVSEAVIPAAALELGGNLLLQNLLP